MMKEKHFKQGEKINVEDGEREREREMMMKLGEEKDYKEKEKNDDEVRGKEERPNGIINQIFSNLVSGGREEEENQGSGDNKESEGKVLGGEEEEKEGGGRISHFISNYLVSPLSPKGSNEKKVEDFEAEDERTSGGGGGGGIVNGVKTEEEGGGGGGDGGRGGEGEGIIDRLVSHLPTPLADYVDPATDESSVLIHSIVHD